MYIGKLSKLSDVSVKAIRHYEAIGLLRNIPREGKYRVYEAHHIVIIKMIKTAQQLGFKLKDIKPLIDQKYQQNAFPLEVANHAIDLKSQELKAQIEAINQQLNALEDLKQSLVQTFAK